MLQKSMNNLNTTQCDDEMTMGLCKKVRESEGNHRRADPDWPSATRRFQSLRHCCMLARSFLSLATFSIHANSAFSSSGTKKEDSKDSTLSKFAEEDVMCS